MEFSPPEGTKPELHIESAQKRELPLPSFHTRTPTREVWLMSEAVSEYKPRYKRSSVLQGGCV